MGGVYSIDLIENVFFFFFGPIVDLIGNANKTNILGWMQNFTPTMVKLNQSYP